MRISSFFFTFFLILMFSCYSPTAQLIIQSNNYSSTANLSTTWTALYKPVQQDPIPILRTGDFTCGFIDIANAAFSSYVLAIYISYVYLTENKVVWSANRDYPVSDYAMLNFTATGDLVLHDADGSLVWTTNTTGKSVAGMNLTETGNLVLFDDHNSVVWQSFDYPTDCLVPGQRLYEGQKLKSSVSETNLSEGMFSLQVTDRGLFAYVESNPPQAYYSWLAHGDDKHKGRRYVRYLKANLALFIHSSEPSDPDDQIIIPGQLSPPQYMKLTQDGHLQVFQLDSGAWAGTDVITTYDSCSYPMVCGRNSICSTNQQCSCPTSKYFKAVDDRQPKLGCSEITPITCDSKKDQHFITLEKVQYFTPYADKEGVDMEICKQECLKNCSCKAAFFQPYHSGAKNGDCSFTSEIFTMKNVESRNTGDTGSAFIKVQNVRSHKVATIVGSTVGSIVVVLVVAIGFITYRVHKRKRDAEKNEDYLDQVPGLPNRFSYEELKTATENFNKKLGEGGFGSVYEGTLGDSTRIAVKCLKGLEHVKKSFLAEVQSIGSIHHVNLVRLRGFCTWKSEQFLVYDFMSNGSLDRWIYHGKRERILEWECRKKIILDISKGLAYLHEDCRQKIVHLDIKPQNILLDNDFNAKVSDFGLSKLIDKNQTQVMSTTKGTPGYIAPERRSSIITEKADVYSFGIVLLEILCGRQFFDRHESEESMYLLSVFEKCWEQGTLLNMVDRHSEDMQAHKTEVVEMMKLASWCLQRNFKRRPSMSSVVKVLEGGTNVESNLDYNFTDPRIQEITVQDEKDSTQLLPSLLSGPR